MQINNRDLQIVRKIIKYCNEVQLTHESFQNDKQLFCDREKGFIYRNSISMPVMQIGELVKNLSREFTSGHDRIFWREIARMRDFFAHHYGMIDYEITWNTSQHDIPELKNYLENIE